MNIHMTALPLNVGPSSWDRDMAGLDEDPDDAKLAELGMHLEGDSDKEEEEEEDDGLDTDAVATAAASDDDEEDEDDETGIEELDELAELDRLEKEIDTVTEREDFVIEDEM
ncbi:MAG: hypothetical protein KC662_02055 [Candidatus Magasanikbacteria bacterium]|nr:hypothetical protein [Candidatus Magasanikbacteria bacterium]